MNVANAITSTAATGTEAPLTPEGLREAMESPGDDPLAAWMRRQGSDPANGWRLFLPESFDAQFGPPFGAPDYVIFSQLIDAPLLVHSFSTRFQNAAR